MNIRKAPPTNALAFSLVELSIVLVILGLLVGGVLSGKSLIRAAELRSVTMEHSRYISAVQSFRDKYFALPGDMTNAQSFWGVAHATPATCITTASTTTATCNGNGDGMINYAANWDKAPGSNEGFRFWQHLANAGLIEGTYDGVGAGGLQTDPTNTNTPRPKVNSQAYWEVWQYGTGNAWSTSWRFDGDYGNVMDIKLRSAGAGPFGVLKAEEAWNLDIKMDDGKPATGKVVIHNDTSASWSGCTTAASSADLSATYLLTSIGKCAILFRNQF